MRCSFWHQWVMKWSIFDRISCEKELSRCVREVKRHANEPATIYDYLSAISCVVIDHPERREFLLILKRDD